MAAPVAEAAEPAPEPAPPPPFRLELALPLEAALRLYFSDPALLRRSGRATQEAVERFGGATTRIMQSLEPWLTHMQAEWP
jgi:hypothetical protein